MCQACFVSANGARIGCYDLSIACNDNKLFNLIRESDNVPLQKGEV